MQSCISRVLVDSMRTSLFRSKRSRVSSPLLISSPQKDIAGILPDDLVNSLLSAWSSASLVQCRTHLDTIEREGYSATQLLIQLLAALRATEDVGGLAKARMAMALGKCEARLVDGADEAVQLLALVCS